MANAVCVAIEYVCSRSPLALLPHDQPLQPARTALASPRSGGLALRRPSGHPVARAILETQAMRAEGFGASSRLRSPTPGCRGSVDYWSPSRLLST